MRAPLLACALLLPSLLAAAEEPPRTLEIAEYREALRGMASALEAREWDQAFHLAEALRGVNIASDAGTFEADPTLLRSVAATRDTLSGMRARKRILAVLASLEGGGVSASPADAALLARLSRELAASAPQPEKDAPIPTLREPTLPERVRAWIRSARDAVQRFLRRLMKWLSKLGPRRAGNRDEAGNTGPAVLALVVVILLLLAVAFVWTLRRRGEEALPESLAGVALAARDEDPLSREAGEWERYAGELAQAGRRREAIRAWYHAVLVTLFQAGRLHHQRGRTNWEYFAAVSPEAGWRPAFESLTRTFDREWYGRDASAPEALRECAARAREILAGVHAEAGA